jgi:hypothetical protein
MTEFRPTMRQPLTPGTPAAHIFPVEQAVRGAHTGRILQGQQEEETQSQAGPMSVADAYYPAPGARAQQNASEQAYVRAPRKPFNWRRVGWILAVLAAIWTLGAAYDIATGHANPVAPGVFAAVSAAGALIAFAVPRRDRDR